MEGMDGDILLGDINGTAIGGARITVGKSGGALYLDGNMQYILFNKPIADVCFWHPRECSVGLSMAMWIVLFKDQPTASVHLYDNGGARQSGTGYRIRYYSPKPQVFIAIGDGIKRYDYGTKIPTSVLDGWVHFTIVWAPGNGIRVYLNGCDMDINNTLGYAKETDGLYDKLPTDLFIGNRPIGTQPAHMKMDDFKFWNRVLPPVEIWENYITHIWLLKIFPSTCMPL